MPQTPVRSSLWNALLHLTGELIISVVVVATFIPLRYVVSSTFPPGMHRDILRHLMLISRWAAFSALIISLARIMYWVIVRVYGLSRHKIVEKNASRITEGSQMPSFLIGILGLIVVFALLDRAEMTRDTTAKLLIYLSGFLLGFEVLFMATVIIKPRVMSTISASEQGSTQAYTA